MLQQKLTAQSFTRDDMRYMAQEKRRLEQELNSTTQNHIILEAVHVESVKGLSAICESIDRKGKTYNNFVESLTHNQAHWKRTKGIDFAFGINRFALGATDMRVVDIKGIITERLSKIKETYISKIHKYDNEIKNVSQKLMRLEKKIADLREENRLTHTQIKQLEKDFQLSSEAYNSEVASMFQQTYSMKIDVSKQQKMTRQTQAESDEKLMKAHLNFKVLSSCTRNEQVALNENLESTFRVLGEHKTQIRKMVQTTYHCVQTHKQKMVRVFSQT